MDPTQPPKLQDLHQVQLVPQLIFRHPFTDQQNQGLVDQQVLQHDQTQQQPKEQQNKQQQQQALQLMVYTHNHQPSNPKPFNPLQLSLPTTTTATNPTHSQQQLTLKQLDIKYVHQSSPEPICSNLQALKNLPRKITKNSHVKIQCKTEFPLVRAVAVGQFGWTLMSKESHKQLVDVIWTDTYVTEELVNRLRPYQKVNHFPYSTQMGRKDYLFANLNKMRAKNKDEYDFFARTWIFPEDYQKFKEDTQISSSSQIENNKTFYIAKPVASCQGKGIFLAKRSDILAHTSSHKLLVQQYIHNTLLIEGLKFDTRIYVLIKSFQPLTIYIYKQGLTRLATTQYQPPNDSNYRNGRMHLTNYAINKNNPNFIHNKDFRKDNVGHKRSLGSLYSQMEKMGADVGKVKEKVKAIIVKTVLAVYEKMTYLEKLQHRIPAARESIKNLSIVDTNEDGLFAREPKTSRPSQNPIIEYSFNKPENSSKCFQLLGFDIMFTNDFQPKLIEINHQPSLTASSPLDYIIKKCLIIDVFSLLAIDSKEKESYLMSQRDTDGQSGNGIRGFEVKGAKKQISGNGWLGITGGTDKGKQMGGFECIYPIENTQLMSLYHRLMPMLLIHQQPPQTRAKRRDSSFSFNKSNLPTFPNPFRQTKTSLNKKRQQYTCNYINMMGGSDKTKGNSQIKEGEDEKTNDVIVEQNGKGEENKEGCQKKVERKPSQSVRETYGIGKITPRIKMSKLTQYDMPKKNLNFTIKHMRSTTKSIPKEPDPQQLLNNLPAQQQTNTQSPSSQTTAKPQTPYPASRTPLSKASKTLGTRITLTNDYSRTITKQVTKQLINTQPRHSSHDTRIGIRLIKQKHQSIGKIEIMTRGIGTPSEVSHRQTISLEKYSYPIYEKNPTSSTATTPNSSNLLTHQSTLNKPQSRSMRRNAQYFDRVYQKELIQRLNKMKTMKEKLQKLKRNSNRSDQQFIVTREQFRIGSNVVNDNSHKGISNGLVVENSGHVYTQQVKNKSHSITTIQAQTGSFHIEQQKHQPFQTIKLIQFEQPQIKKTNHNHTQKHQQSKDKFNSSMEMFKDEAFFNSHKKQGIIG